MRSKSAIRLFAYACIAIPALILFVENRFFEAGAIGWLSIGILAIAIVESYVGIRWRKAVTPPYPNGPSNRPLVGSTNGPSHSSTDVELPALSEHNPVMNTEYKMKSNQGWCPLNPKELIDYVSPKGATEVARTQRSRNVQRKTIASSWTGERSKCVHQEKQLPDRRAGLYRVSVVLVGFGRSAVGPRRLRTVTT